MVGVHSFKLTVSGPGFWSWATAHGVMKWGWRMEMESVFSSEYMGPCPPVSSYPPAQAKSNAASLPSPARVWRRSWTTACTDQSRDYRPVIISLLGTCQPGPVTIVCIPACLGRCIPNYH